MNGPDARAMAARPFHRAAGRPCGASGAALHSRHVRLVHAAAAALLTLLIIPDGRAMAAASDLRWRGQFDAVAASRGGAIALNALNRGDTMFDTYRLRLFAEGRVADGFDVFAQTLVQEDLGFSLYGAYAMWTPIEHAGLHVIGGKIPWRIGTYAERTYAPRNPLIGVPLMYHYHTSLRPDRLPPNADALAGAAGSGQDGPVYDAGGRGYRGMPVVYDRCWDFGIMALGGARPFEFSAGFVNGTPGAPNAGNDRNNGRSWLGRVGVQPWPGVRVGVSGSHGPWLADTFADQMPAGRTVNGFAQRLLMADAEWLFARIELRGEGLWNEWQTPTAGDVDLRGGYVEGRVGLESGAFIAGRWDVLRFGDVVDSTGAARAWDDDLARFEGGAGYRVQRGVTLKAVYQRTWFLRGSERRESLYALQGVFEF
jgi:hypothetical protein